MKYADLHIHTLFSDGTFSPKEVVELATKEGLSCISVTDHDTVEEVDLVSQEAEKAGLESIPGIEITSDENGKEFHILGYFLDYKDKDFLKLLKKISLARIDRVYDMADKLKKFAVRIDPEEIFELAGKGIVGRLHIARVMLKKGYVSSISQAFQKYIGNGGPCYVARFKLTPKEAIEAIIKIGGVPVLAHPYNLVDDAMIPELIAWGLRGIEAYYLDYPQSVTEKYISLANKYGLLVTGGSDCHGLAKEEVRIGKIKIPYDLVERLKDAKFKKV